MIDIKRAFSSTTTPAADTFHMYNCNVQHSHVDLITSRHVQSQSLQSARIFVLSALMIARSVRNAVIGRVRPQKFLGLLQAVGARKHIDHASVVSRLDLQSLSAHLSKQLAGLGYHANTVRKAKEDEVANRVHTRSGRLCRSPNLDAARPVSAQSSWQRRALAA